MKRAVVTTRARAERGDDTKCERQLPREFYVLAGATEPLPAWKSPKQVSPTSRPSTLSAACSLRASLMTLDVSTGAKLVGAQASMQLAP